MRALSALATALCIAGSAPAMQVVEGSGAVLRGLDRISGRVTDINIRSGRTVRFGSLSIHLEQCRYPFLDPLGDGFAYLVIGERGEPVFSGWMIASSPALNALDHQRYDVWALRCTGLNWGSG